MKFKIFTAFAFILAAVGLMSAQQQGNSQPLGQFCHSGLTDPLHGLYCTTINAKFVPQEGSGDATSIEILDGQVTPITGTLTFAPGPPFIPYDDVNESTGDPICYQKDSSGGIVLDANANPTVVACPQYQSYDITQWDITIGPTHLVHNPDDWTFPATNSGCGYGYGGSVLTSNGAIAYYICGDNQDTASTGLIVLVIPIHYLMGGKNNGYTNLVAQATDSNGNVWMTGLHLVRNGIYTSPNGSAVAALDPAPKKNGASPASARFQNSGTTARPR